MLTKTPWIILIALALAPAVSLAQNAGKHVAIKKSRVTYLGVASTPVPNSLRVQMKLPAEVGLLVRFTQKGTPAEKAGIKPHDILYKFDKQILVNQHQLRALIRMHQPGDKVVLTVVREGKSQDLTLELGEKEVIEPAPVQPLNKRPGNLKIQPIPQIDLKDQGVWVMPRNQEELLKRFEEQMKNSGMKQEQIDQVLKEQKQMLQKMQNVPWGRIRRNNDGDLRIERHQKPGNVQFKNQSTMAYSDNEHNLKITIEDAHKMLVAKDKNGNVLYQGPINTDEQRKLVPPAVLKKLNQLEKQVQIEIQRHRPPAQPKAPVSK